MSYIRLPSECREDSQFEYVESSGSLILDASSAVKRNSLFPEPTVSFTSGDVKGMFRMLI